MTKLMQILVLIFGASFLAACGSIEGQGHIDEVNKLSLKKPFTFNEHLAKHYRTLANFEWNKMLDYKDGNNYAKKALAAAKGELVLPENPKDWSLPKEHVAEISSAYRMLMEFLTAGAAEKMPIVTGHAQTSFDCWVEQQDENWQFKDIADCRKEFYKELNKLKANIDLDGRYVIFFKTDSAYLNARDKMKLDRVVKDMRRGYLDEVHIVGHTDTVGSEDYNLELSKKRARALKDYLVSKGIDPKKITTEGVGYKQLMVPTGPGVAEAKNRRAVIHFIE